MRYKLHKQLRPISRQEAARKKTLCRLLGIRAWTQPSRKRLRNIKHDIFGNIVNSFQPLTIFRKKLYLRCLKGFWIHVCNVPTFSCNHFMTLSWIGFNCLKAAEPLRGDSLLWITKSQEVPTIRFIDLGKVRGWVDFEVTQWFGPR